MKLFVKSPAKILIQAIGNPLRGDDGVGPLLIERFMERSIDQLNERKRALEEERLAASVDFEWVYQLQIENAEQWRRYETVIVVDADMAATESLTWREITPQEEVATQSFHSHQQSPDSVYRLMREFFEGERATLATRVFVLGIYAEKFELGEVLSEKSKKALNEAQEKISLIMKSPLFFGGEN